MSYTVMNFAIPKSKLSPKIAAAIAGNLGKPSKMPGFTYGISAKLCKIGAKLAKIKGSVCFDCYALKANYQYPSVTKAHDKRERSLSSISWVDSMIILIEKTKNPYFRWHDAGDIQNFQHLLDIVKIAEALPSVSFWLPTREKALILRYRDIFGDFPANLCVRLSAAMVDAKPLSGFENTSTVHSSANPCGQECIAYKQGNKCLDCRACWDKTIQNISYRKH